MARGRGPRTRRGGHSPPPPTWRTWLRVGAQLSAPVPCPRKRFLPELQLAGADGALQSSPEQSVQWLFSLQNKTAFSSLPSPQALTGEKAVLSPALPWLGCPLVPPSSGLPASCLLDPFFPLSFLVNSWFPGMLDDLFQSVFLCALLLFWLCVYHGIRVQVSPRC